MQSASVAMVSYNVCLYRRYVRVVYSSVVVANNYSLQVNNQLFPQNSSLILLVHLMELMAVRVALVVAVLGVVHYYSVMATLIILYLTVEPVIIVTMDGIVMCVHHWRFQIISNQ